MRLPAPFFVSLHTSARTLMGRFAPRSFFLGVILQEVPLAMVKCFPPVSGSVVVASCPPTELEQSRECPAGF